MRQTRKEHFVEKVTLSPRGGNRVQVDVWQLVSTEDGVSFYVLRERKIVVRGSPLLEHKSYSRVVLEPEQSGTDVAGGE